MFFISNGGGLPKKWQSKLIFTMENKICEYCQKRFTPKFKCKNRFCSVKCSDTSRRLKPKACRFCNELFTPIRSARQFCSHKCGSDSQIKQSGYKNIKKIGGHRIIMDRLMGGQLRKEEIVHHIDGSPQNNSINNLMVMSRSSHKKIHDRERKYEKQAIIYNSSP
jgi:hypothetical protein